MTEQEQIEICKALAVTCMWGQGGIASVFLERLDRYGPAGPKGWYETYNARAKDAKRESMGVITDKAELDRYRALGYWVTNFDEDGASLFNPPPMNGLCKYVSKELAEPLRKRERTHTQTYPAPLPS
jgi:hypothetical protein